MNNLAEDESENELVDDEYEYEESFATVEAEYPANNSRSLSQELLAALEQKNKTTVATLLQQEKLLQLLYDGNSLTALGQKVAVFLCEYTATALEHNKTRESLESLIKQFIKENGENISSVYTDDLKNNTKLAVFGVDIPECIPMLPCSTKMGQSNISDEPMDIIDLKSSSLQPYAKCIVDGYYESNDILILRDAILAKHSFKVKAQNLVERLDGNRLEVNTYILPPSKGLEVLVPLTETFCIAILCHVSTTRILFPYRMKNAQHWVTGQIDILNKENITLTIHDSANIYKKEEFEDRINCFLQNISLVQQFLAEKERIKECIDNAKVIVSSLFAEDGQPKTTFLNSGRSKIYAIQVDESTNDLKNVYCGGYATRLICNIAINYSKPVTDRDIWGCHEKYDDNKLRNQDGDIVAKYNSEKVGFFGSKGNGDEYQKSEVHHQRINDQEANLEHILLAMKNKVSELSNDTVNKMYQAASISLNSDNPEIEIKRRLIRIYDSNKEQLLQCNPLGYFFSNPDEKISENSEFNSGIVLRNLWDKFVEMLKNRLPSENIHNGFSYEENKMQSESKGHKGASIGNKTMKRGLHSNANTMHNQASEPNALKEQDISKLRETLEIISKFNQENMFNSLQKIGDLLHSINWDENDLFCIRNKHGYRNRGKGNNNERNTTGAGIDFEKLCHLRLAVYDTVIKNLLKNNFVSVEESLKILKRKIDFIFHSEKFVLSQEPLEENEINLSDIGCLWRIAAYYHDIQCIKKILGHIKEIDDLRNINLNDRIFRYSLAYIFCQLGETAKEVSDFIKEECEPLKNMFKWLGAYRQYLKDNIYVVININNKKLKQMLVYFKKISQNLQKLLINLEILLKKSSDKVSSYKLVLGEMSEAGNVEKIVLDKNQYAMQIGDITESLKYGTKDFKRKIKILNEEIERLENEKNKITNETEILQNKEEANAQELKFFGGKDFQQFVYLLEKLENEYLLKTFDDLEKVALNEHEKKSKTKNHDPVLALGKKLSIECRTDIERCLGLSTSTLNGKTLLDIKTIIKEFKIANSGKLKSKKMMPDKISKIDTYISKKQKELQTTKTMLDHDMGNDWLEHNEKIAVRLNNIACIHNEIKFLKQTIQTKDDYSRYSIKMAMGIIGQLCKNIKDGPLESPDLEKYVNVLLSNCMSKAIYARSTIILHDTSNLDDNSLYQILDNFILPSEKDFDALNVVVNNDVSKKEHLILALAFIRLGVYHESLEILKEYLDMIDAGKIANNIDYLLLEKNFPKLWEARQSCGVGEEYKDLYKQNEQRAVECYEKIFTYSLMLDCYTKIQDFNNALIMSENLSREIEYVIQKLCTTMLIFEIQDEPYSTMLNGMVKIGLYSRLQKGYVLLNLGKKTESFACLEEIKKFVDSLLLNKKEEYNSILARIYTDLLYHAQDNNPADLNKEYILKLESVVKSCEDSIIIQFNIYFRKYEISQKKLLENHKIELTAGQELIGFFDVNENAFKERLGIDFFRYKMEVELVRYNVCLWRKELAEAYIILGELDNMIVNVKDIVTSNKYFFSKLLALVLKDDFAGYCGYLERFFRNNINGTSHKFRETVFTIIDCLPDCSNFKDFSISFVKKKIHDLTEDEQLKLKSSSHLRPSPQLPQFSMSKKRGSIEEPDFTPAKPRNCSKDMMCDKLKNLTGSKWEYSDKFKYYFLVGLDNKNSSAHDTLKKNKIKCKYNPKNFRLTVLYKDIEHGSIPANTFAGTPKVFI